MLNLPHIDDLLLESATKEALKQEKSAFKLLQSKGLKPFVRPKGKDQAFPDFAFTMKVGDITVDLHFEYKMNKFAQMGSLSRWAFNGKKFTAPIVGEDDGAALLLELMNKSAICLASGRRILDAMSVAFNYDFNSLSGGMLKPFNAEERRTGLMKMYKKTEGLTLAYIENAKLGGMMLDHYRSKFVPRPKADVSVLMFMVGNDIAWVDADGDFTPELQTAVAAQLGVAAIPRMTNPVVGLEVRVQPKYMSDYRSLVATHGKQQIDKELRHGDFYLEPPVMIMMATYRLRNYDQGVTLT